MGFVPLRLSQDFFAIGYKNSSYIWGPNPNEAIGEFFALFTPEIFKTVPVGQYAGQIKYWPWFWLIVPVYVLVTPIAFGLSMIFDHKALKADINHLKDRIANKKKVRS